MMKTLSTRTKRIVITGGHLTPAQAVIEELKKRGEWEIYYLGRKYSLEGQMIPSIESEVIPKLGVKFIPFPAGRFQRRFSSSTFLSLLRIPFAFVYSLALLLKIRPGVILSFGGYVSLPIVVTGWFLRIPILTHEQTVVSGLANQINAHFAQKVFISFPESLKHFSRNKVILTGNPIRKEIFTYRISHITYHISQEKLPLLYITGGNQGAQVINQAVVAVLSELLQKYRIIHQCGKLDFNHITYHISHITSRLRNRYFLTDYVDSKDIGWVLNQADLIVSRAGANIVSELAALGKPAILIPLPWAYKDEQIKNAQMLVGVGTAVILSQTKCNGKNLKDAIDEMMDNIEDFKANASKAKKIIIKDADQKIVDQIFNLLER